MKCLARPALVAALVLQSAAACSVFRGDSGKTSGTDSTKPPPDVSAAETFSIGVEPSRSFGGPDTWGYIADLFVLGDSLFVYDLYGPPAITVLDRRTGSVIGALGRAGSGPGEYRDVTDVFRAEEGSGRFWVYDVAARRLSLYEPAGLGGARLRETRPIARPGWPEGVRLDHGGLIMGGTFPGSSPVLETDSTGRLVRQRMGTYPASARTENAPPVLMINRPNVAFHPSLRKLALAYMYQSVLQIYDRDTRQVARIPGPEPLDSLTDAQILNLNPTLVAYSVVRATSRFVYAMFCGCDFAPRHPEKAGTRLHVVSWDGTTVALVPVHPPAILFAVSADDRFLYTVQDDPYPHVVEIRLPPEIRDHVVPR